jgi:hypothetical protein
MAKRNSAAQPVVKRSRGKPAHVPTDVDRETVRVMVAGGFSHDDIARARGISDVTLRKYYREELDAGAAAVNAMVLVEHIKRIKAGDFQAIKFWEQTRMGWSEKVTIDDPRRDQALRVVVEFMGKAEAPPVLDDDARLRGMGSVTGPRIPGSVVQLKG